MWYAEYKHSSAFNIFLKAFKIQQIDFLEDVFLDQLAKYYIHLFLKFHSDRNAGHNQEKTSKWV